MGVGKRVVVIMVVVGVLLTTGGYYLLCSIPSFPSIAERVKEVVETSKDPNSAEGLLREMMAKESGLISVEVEGFAEGDGLILEKELQGEEPVVKVSLPFKNGVITVGLSRSLFLKQSIGARVLLFGVIYLVVFCTVVLFILQGVNERLLSIAGYLKEAEIEELDELTMERWPPEIKQVVASIDILLKKVEKRLKLKVEEARRDRLFVHNAMVELVECLNQAAQGNLRVRAETPADIVGALGEAFNDAVAILENRISDAQRVLYELEKAFEGGCEETESIREDLAKAKRALFYFKTEVARRIESGSPAGSLSQSEPSERAGEGS